MAAVWLTSRVYIEEQLGIAHGHGGDVHADELSPGLLVKMGMPH